VGGILPLCSSMVSGNPVAVQPWPVRRLSARRAVGLAPLNIGAIQNDRIMQSGELEPKSIRELLVGQHRADQEFNSIKHMADEEMRRPRAPRSCRPNPAKDFCDQVTPFEHNRARALDGGYINASVMPGTLGGNFIAAQGPLRGTVEDFWSMVANHRVQRIVSLCGNSECAEYMPTENNPLSLLGGVLRITTVREDALPRAVGRQAAGVTGVARCAVEVQHGNDRWILTRLHYVAWADRGTIAPAALLELAEVASAGPSDVTTLVHCRAGVGRTGCLLALCALLARCRTQRALGVAPRASVAATVLELREHRPHMVQTPDQYRLLYAALGEWLRGQ